MTILQRIGDQIQQAFPANEHGQERAQWFLLTLQSILMPITASRTSNLLRTIATVFGWNLVQNRFYTFMASPKLPWKGIWSLVWRSIPEPLTEGRLLLALDDSLNPKTGKKVFGCDKTFDHAAKTNQSRYPWAQTIVTVGLLRIIHGRWACLPLAYAFYLRAVTVRREQRTLGGQRVVFKTLLLKRWTESSTSPPCLPMFRSWSSPIAGSVTTVCGNRWLLRSARELNC